MSEVDYYALAKFAEEAHEIARSKGWWDDYEGRDLTPDEIAAKLALVHSEVSEALESVRNGEELLWYGEGGKPEGVIVEMADAIIRLAELGTKLCGEGETIAHCIGVKMDYNRTRPHKHGGKVI